MHDLPDRFIVVNVPAFRLYYVEQGQVRFVTNVVVGKLYRRCQSGGARVLLRRYLPA